MPAPTLLLLALAAIFLIAARVTAIKLLWDGLHGYGLV